MAVLKQESQTMGPQVAMFQKEFAKIFEVKHAFATSNCTTAMHVATQAFGIKAGDEVIVTPITFIATSLVILKEGAKPVYADIDPKTFNIDPKQIESKITPKTKAIYVVHYGGQMCDMDPIMAIAKKHNLFVLEDCAHAHGAKYKGRQAGSIGDIGCFSFHSLKNMMTLGEGGMITTNNDTFADKIQTDEGDEYNTLGILIRKYGNLAGIKWKRKVIKIIGYPPILMLLMMMGNGVTITG